MGGMRSSSTRLLMVCFDPPADGLLLVDGGNLHSADEIGGEIICKARHGGVEGAQTTRTDNDQFDRSGQRSTLRR